MTNTVSFGVIGFTDGQSKTASLAKASATTIVHSTVVGRRTFGQLAVQSVPEVLHSVTRRRTSAM